MKNPWPPIVKSFRPFFKNFVIFCKSSYKLWLRRFLFQYTEQHHSIIWKEKKNMTVLLLVCKLHLKINMRYKLYIASQTVGAIQYHFTLASSKDRQNHNWAQEKDPSCIYHLYSKTCIWSGVHGRQGLQPWELVTMAHPTGFFPLQSPLVLQNRVHVSYSSCLNLDRLVLAFGQHNVNSKFIWWELQMKVLPLGHEIYEVVNSVDGRIFYHWT